MYVIKIFFKSRGFERDELYIQNVYLFNILHFEEVSYLFHHLR